MNRVSVIIPTYNRASVISRAIDSVISQTYEDIELIIVDDASTDDTKAVIEQLDNDCIRYHRFKQNRGANAARNKGIELATGQYVAFLDSDDEWNSTKIETQIEQLIKNEFSVSYTSVKHVNERGEINGVSHAKHTGDITADLLKKNVVGTFSSVVVHTDVIDQVGPPDPELPCWQDWEWYLRLSKTAIFRSIQKPLTIRHNEGDQISNSFIQKRDQAYPVLKKRISQFATTEKMKRTGYAHLNYELGYAALTSNHYSSARNSFIRAIRKYPWEKKFYTHLFLSGRHFPHLRKIKRYIVRSISTASSLLTSIWSS